MTWLSCQRCGACLGKSFSWQQVRTDSSRPLAPTLVGILATPFNQHRVVEVRLAQRAIPFPGSVFCLLPFENGWLVWLPLVAWGAPRSPAACLRACHGSTPTNFAAHASIFAIVGRPNAPSCYTLFQKAFLATVRFSKILLLVPVFRSSLK